MYAETFSGYKADDNTYDASLLTLTTYDRIIGVCVCMRLSASAFAVLINNTSDHKTSVAAAHNHTHVCMFGLEIIYIHKYTTLPVHLRLLRTDEVPAMMRLAGRER